jgi:hypothetical protein
MRYSTEGNRGFFDPAKPIRPLTVAGTVSIAVAFELSMISARCWELISIGVKNTLPPSSKHDKTFMRVAVKERGALAISRQPRIHCGLVTTRAARV